LYKYFTTFTKNQILKILTVKKFLNNKNEYNFDRVAKLM